MRVTDMSSITMNGKRETKHVPRRLKSSGMLLLAVVLAMSVDPAAAKLNEKTEPTPEELTTEFMDHLPRGQYRLNAGVVHGAISGGKPKTSFTATKSFVTQMCESGDRAACEDACAGASDCCSFHKGMDVTCLQEELEGCVTHSGCHVLQQEEGEEDIPAAPEALTDWCNGADLTACQEACKPVECCYDPQAESCVRDKFLTCLDYAPCQNLRSNAALKVAPSNLDEVCNPFTGDKDTCETMCQAGDCCWDQNLFRNCLPNNLLTCLTYAPCGTLLIDGANSVMPTPPEDLDEICTLQELLLGDSSKCEDACKPATCCVDLDRDDNCFLSDPLGCLEYDACGLLWLLQRGDEVPKPPANLGQTCSLGAVMDDPQACRDMCDVAQCCVDRDFNENCLVKGNVLRCREYAPCSLLAIFGRGGDEDDVVVEDPPESLSQTCSLRSVFSRDGRQACEDLCNQAKCCTARGDENCLQENMGTCLDWASQGCWLVGF